MDYKVDVTIPETGTTKSRYRIRNIGTDDMDIRADVTANGTSVSWILSGNQNEGWYGADDTWISPSLPDSVFQPS